MKRLRSWCHRLNSKRSKERRSEGARSSTRAFAALIVSAPAQGFTRGKGKRSTGCEVLKDRVLPELRRKSETGEGCREDKHHGGIEVHEAPPPPAPEGEGGRGVSDCGLRISDCGLTRNSPSSCLGGRGGQGGGGFAFVLRE